MNQNKKPAESTPDLKERSDKTVEFDQASQQKIDALNQSITSQKFGFAGEEFQLAALDLDTVSALEMYQSFGSGLDSVSGMVETVLAPGEYPKFKRALFKEIQKQLKENRVNPNPDDDAEPRTVKSILDEIIDDILDIYHLGVKASQSKKSGWSNGLNPIGI